MGKNRGVIVDVNVFINGYGNIGIAESFKAPALKQKSISSATAAGDRSISIGQFESLDSDITFKALPKSIYNEMTKLDNAEIILKKAVKEGEEVRNYMWTLTGALSIEYGESKAGVLIDVKVSQKGLKKYVHEIDNTVKVKIDHENLIVEIEGKDILGDVRSILKA